MIEPEILTDENYIILSARHYDNPQCFDNTEFFNDLKRVKYIKRLLNRYKSLGDLKERLILNHIIILYNCFNSFATKLLFLKLEKFYDILVPFLEVIGRLPEKIEGIGHLELIIDTRRISRDIAVVEILKKI